MTESVLSTLEKSGRIFMREPILLIIPFFPAVVSLLSWLVRQSYIKGYLNNAHSGFMMILLHFAAIFSYIFFLSILILFIYGNYKKLPTSEIFGKIYSRGLEIFAVCFLISTAIEIGIRLFVLPGLIAIFFSLFIIPFMLIDGFGMMRSVRMSIYLSKRNWYIILLYSTILLFLSIVLHATFSILGVAGDFISRWIVYGYSASVLLNIYLPLRSTIRVDEDKN